MGQRCSNTAIKYIGSSGSGFNAVDVDVLIRNQIARDRRST